MRTTYGPLIGSELVVNLTNGEALRGELTTVVGGALELGRRTVLVKANGEELVGTGRAVLVPAESILFVQVVSE